MHGRQAQRQTPTHRGMVIAFTLSACIFWPSFSVPTAGQQTAEATADEVNIRLRGVDLRVAIQALGRYLDKPVVVSSVPPVAVDFFETPVPVARGAVPELLRGLLEAHGQQLLEEDAFYRVIPAGQEPVAEAAAPPPEEPLDTELRLHTVHLRHAKAADVAALLNQLFGAGQGPGAAAGAPVRPVPATQRQESPGATTSGAALRGQVTIVPDEATNALLVRATVHDFDLLRSAIQQLDLRPLQVLIEVVMVEARKDRSFSLGIGFGPSEDEAPAPVATSEPIEGAPALDPEPRRSTALETANDVTAELTGTTLGDLVVRVMNLGRADLDFFLSAARSRGDVRIVSRPVVVATNNTEASILVGTEQPFVQVSRSLPTDTPQRDQVVQYRDVGTQISVIPTINRDGYVSLQIEQEMSSATGETQFDAPVISSRQTTTQVLIGDGQTVVVGGLTDKVTDEVRRGIPLLVDIPLIGGLFGSTRTRTTETEIFLFITPTILWDDDDAAFQAEQRLPPDIELGERAPPETPGPLRLDPVDAELQIAVPDSIRPGGQR